MWNQKETKSHKPFPFHHIALVTITEAWFCLGWWQRRRGIDTAAVPWDWRCFKLRTVLNVSGGFQRQPLHVHRVGRTISPARTPTQSGSACLWGQARFPGPGKVCVEPHHVPTRWEKSCFHFMVKGSLTNIRASIGMCIANLTETKITGTDQVTWSGTGRERRRVRPEFRHSVTEVGKGERSGLFFVILLIAGLNPWVTLWITKGVCMYLSTSIYLFSSLPLPSLGKIKPSLAEAGE